MPRVRAELARRLNDRQGEVEDSILARLEGMADEGVDDYPGYVAGRRAAVAEWFEYLTSSLEGDESLHSSVPPALAAQVRRSARLGLDLDSLLRHQVAVERLIDQVLLEAGDSLPAAAVRTVLRSRDSLADRLLAGIAVEYEAEAARLERSPMQRRAEQVERLINTAGFAEPTEFEYDFDGWHLGLVASGRAAETLLRSVLPKLGQLNMIVPREDGLVWAWIGDRRPIRIADLARAMERRAAGGAADLRLAIGEPRAAIDGWRLTHWEARAALRVALRRSQLLTRGSDMLLLAAVLHDKPLAWALRENFIAPLDRDGNAGPVLRQTLGAYFAAGGNAAAAGVALRVTRQTVQRRLRRVEISIGRLLDTCRAEIEVALMLEQLEEPVDT